MQENGNLNRRAVDSRHVPTTHFVPAHALAATKREARARFLTGLVGLVAISALAWWAK